MLGKNCYQSSNGHTFLKTHRKVIKLIRGKTPLHCQIEGIKTSQEPEIDPSIHQHGHEFPDEIKKIYIESCLLSQYLRFNAKFFI